MSRGLRLGGRVFVPSAGFTVVALLLCALCVRLGTWQWHKGMQREQEWTHFARGADQVIALGARAVSDVPLFQRVSVTGRLESARQFLLDNRTYRGRAGYEVLTPLARAGAAVLLVDRGWVPFSGSRARLPDIAFEAAAPVTLSGRLAELPSPGLASGRAGPEAHAPWPKVTSYPRAAELGAARGAHSAARPAGPVRLRARLAAARPGAAAAPRLRHPVVELRDAGAHRVGDPEHAQKPRRPDAMNTPARALRARNLRTLAGLAALFLLPLVMAFFTYYCTGWRPAGHVNHGVLITPARPLPPIRLPQPGGGAAPHGTPFRGHWSLVYVGNGACDSACRRALYVMRQTRLALNNDMPRLRRVFLGSGECCARELLGPEQAV